MEKLTIVVPHYKEPWKTCKFLFDSIECQHGVDYDDFKVLVVNDGDEMVLDRANFAEYSYRIDYVIKPHGGISDTRNYGIDHCESEYIMFCDCDDGFLNNYGLHLVLGAIQEGFDFLHSVFIEEQPVDGGWRVFRRDGDKVFVHGKAYRLQFLKDKNIRFDTEMRLNEDSVFNAIAYHEADVVKKIDTPFYLWTWNGESTVRKQSEDIIIRTYDQVMAMRLKICEQLDERGFIDEFFDAVCKTVADCYYDFNEPTFLKHEGDELWHRAEKQFKKFWRKYSKAYYECDSDRIARTMMESRLVAYNAGLRVERIDLVSWLKHIKNDIN